jgi:1-deoxy-D-xylulose-5-phosphate reductoisomerase
MMKNIAILGSTGSIGLSTLDLCRQHPDKFRIVALAAGNNVDVLIKQIQEFSPLLVSVATDASAAKLRALGFSKTEILVGEAGAVRVASCSEADVVISAIVGAAGLQPTLAAIEAGKTIGLANKESMVIAGEILGKRAHEKNVKILPVDSEHSAIFQCLNGEPKEDVSALILTASGGPFLKRAREDFASITKAEALKHPNWDMGAKITIDSASMMNKGLEVMEARWLFDMPVEKIRVVVHPQSVVHSMVEFVDGSVMAQMGEPDMRAPIAYALSYPRRITTGIRKLDLPTRQQLTFFEPDLEKFTCLKLAFDVARQGGSYAPVLNAANEIAVDLFLNDRIRFIDISAFIDRCLQAHQMSPLRDIADVLFADRWAREFVRTLAAAA